MGNVAQKRVHDFKNILRGVFGRPKKVGLVLGGGAARGVAHVGVLKVLVENKVPIHCIAGTSSGAVFGALFSGGMNPYDMEKLARQTDWLRLAAFRFSMAGAASGEGIEKLVISSIGDRNIEDLRIPLGIVATDLKTGGRVLIRSGNAAKAVHASSAIPGIFSPVQFQGRVLADGMIVDNVPVGAAREMGADFIIAVDVIPDVALDKWSPNVLGVIERALDIGCRSASEEAKRSSNVIIEPVSRNISAFSLNQSKELIKMGEAAANRALPQIKAKLGI